MAEEHAHKSHEFETKPVGEEVESTDRGLFDFLGKKEEEKPQDEVIAQKFDEQVYISEPEPVKVEVEEEKKPSLLEKLHRSGSNSSSSSSSDDETEEGIEKKKKKKGLKEKLKEKAEGDKKEEVVPEKKYEEALAPISVEPETEEKKGFLEKIKGKLPGQHKKPEETPHAATPPPTHAVAHESTSVEEVEAKDKKSIIEKIKEKLPGYHAKTPTEAEKEKEKD